MELKRFWRKSKYNEVIVYFYDRIFHNIDGCWIWSDGLLSNKGYGILPRKHQLVVKEARAHRLSFRLFHGRIDSGKVICHKCDVTSCVNPEHLFQGTQKDNMDDMINKGRANWNNSAAGKHNGAHTCPHKRPRGDTHGLVKHPERIARGSKHGSSILCEKDVLEIRKLYLSGNYTQRELAKIFKISQPVIGKIIKRQLWRHI